MLLNNFHGCKIKIEFWTYRHNSTFPSLVANYQFRVSDSSQIDPVVLVIVLRIPCDRSDKRGAVRYFHDDRAQWSVT